ncbi:MAG: hypothetical protein LBE13_02985 [Bacteroidales bacterium]|jgi:hypothetical protein|nr:hypothetical protein [Bacteroidales bacterium]
MSNYNIIAKTSVELTETDWSKLTNSFNIVFDKQFRIEHFKNKYLKTVLNFSIHSFLLYENNIVGMFSVIPRIYNFNGTEKIIGLGCDAFIIQHHRKDDFFLQEMAEDMYEICKKNNINYLISIPNQTAYLYWKMYGNWKDIAQLDYYILPYKISKILKTGGKLLDCLSTFFFKTILYFSQFLLSESQHYQNKKISLKRDADFLNQRYSGDYKIYKLDRDSYFVVREYNEEDIKTIYIIDCHPLSKYMFTKVLNQIIKDFKFDVILFIGKINNSTPFYFVKVPKSKEPRVQPFMGYLLTEELKEDFLSILSWDISLANFDNR